VEHHPEHRQPTPIPYPVGSSHPAAEPATPELPRVPGAGNREQVVVLREVTWKQYNALCEGREDSSGPRMAYLDGSLEIMSPSPKHEADKTLIARLLEAYAEEKDLSLNGFGSTTYKKKDEEAGAEPDECYVLGPEKPVPDLAIEVLVSRRGVNKLEIYRRLKVREVWYWALGEFWIYRLVRRKYVRVPESEVFPDLDLARLARIVTEASPSAQTETVRAYRRSLRRRKKR